MISDNLLIERAVKNATSKQIGMIPRWEGVSEVFMCSEYVAKTLCNRYNLGENDLILGKYDWCPECGNQIMDENGICPECS